MSANLGYILSQVFDDAITYDEQYKELSISKRFDLMNYPYNLRRIVYRYYSEIAEKYPEFSKQMPLKLFNELFTSDPDMTTIPLSLSSHLQTYHIIRGDKEMKSFIATNPDYKNRFRIFVINDSTMNIYVLILKLNKIIELDNTYRNLSIADKMHIQNRYIPVPVYYNIGDKQIFSYRYNNLLSDISNDIDINISAHTVVLISVLRLEELAKTMQMLNIDNSNMNLFAKRFANWNIRIVFPYLSELEIETQLSFLKYWINHSSLLFKNNLPLFIKYIRKILFKNINSQSYQISEICENILKLSINSNTPERENDKVKVIVNIPKQIYRLLHNSQFYKFMASLIDILNEFSTKNIYIGNVPEYIIKNMTSRQQLEYMRIQNQHICNDYSAIFKDVPENEFCYLLEVNPASPIERMTEYIIKHELRADVNFEKMLKENSAFIQLYMSTLFKRYKASSDEALHETIMKYIHDILIDSESVFNNYIVKSFESKENITTLFDDEVKSYMNKHQNDNIMNKGTYAMLYVKMFHEEPPIYIYHSPIINISFETLSSIWRSNVSRDVVPQEMTDKRYWEYMIKNNGTRRDPNSTTIYTYFSNSTECKIIFVSESNMLNEPAIQRYTIPVNFAKIKEFLTEELDTNNISMPGTVNNHDWEMITNGNSLIDCVVFTDRKDIYCNRTPLKKLLTFFVDSIEINFDISCIKAGESK